MLNLERFDTEDSILWHEIQSQRLLPYASKNFLAFIRYMNPDFRINWHHRVICKKLDDFVEGRITRLMIFVEPQVGKSEMVSRHLPAYIFGRCPDMKLIAAAYGDQFASLFNLDVQRIIDNPKFARVFPGVRLAGKGDDPKKWKRTQQTFDVVGRKGRYHSVGVGGSLTGKPANILIIDDPVKDAKEVASENFRDDQFRWFSSAARTRLRRGPDGVPGRILLTMTRWHEDDLAARLLDLAKKHPHLPQWTVINFPALREDFECEFDERELDQPLWPDNRSREELEEIKLTDSQTWTSLYMQRPSPPEGDILKRGWWRFYTSLPEDLEMLIQAWDLTFKGEAKNKNSKKQPDFVVGQVWGKKGPDKYLVAQVRARMGFDGQITEIENLSVAYPKAFGKFIEDAANAQAALAVLKTKISGINLVTPTGSKVVRAESVAPMIKSGNVYLPDPSIASWVGDFIEECAAFPNGKNDDQVDAMSLGLSQIDGAPITDFTPISMTGVSKWTGMR